jgi:hypothetical protein
MPESASLIARKTVAKALKCGLDAVGPDASVATLPQ